MTRRSAGYWRRSAVRLLLATRSPGKSRELHALLSLAGVNVVDLREAGIPESADEDALETADTFEANALAKARHFHRVSALPTLADDSGLEVTALDGAPGVHSKRWSGRADLRGQELDDANNAMLLERLAGMADRSARYVCAAAYCSANVEAVERGETRGRIATAASGSNGFGYDPLFVSDELASAFGEVPMAVKASVSHRARAFAKLLRHIAPRG